MAREKHGDDVRNEEEKKEKEKTAKPTDKLLEDDEKIDIFIRKGLNLGQICTYNQTLRASECIKKDEKFYSKEVIINANKMVHLKVKEALERPDPEYE